MNREDIKKYIDEYHRSFDCIDEHGSFKSWIQCYTAFFESRGLGETLSDKEIEILCLRLGFYLASWGMFRGDSFIRHYNHMVYQEIIKEILEPKYKDLFGITCEELEKDENKEKFKEISNFIKNRCEELRNSYYESKKTDREIKSPVSEILITKILMGAMGCIPAFDNHFVRGIKEDKEICYKSSYENSLESLTSFYKNNKCCLDKLRKNYKLKDHEYPQMKILDDLFFQIGYEKNQGKSTHKSTNVATV